MPRRSIGMHIAGYVFKGICCLFIFAVIAVIVWRIFTLGEPKEVEAMLPNDILNEAYSENEDLEIFYQNQDDITRAENNYGYFSITSSYFISDIDQVQLVFRYNDSTIEALAEDYNLPEVPDKEETLFDVSLVVAYDLTPDDDTDNDDKENIRYERIHPTSSLVHKEFLYNYEKFVFDGVDMSDDVLAVYVDVYYIEDINYEEEAYGTLIIYDYITEKVEYHLTGKDKEAIEG